eukprot:CAMPEP_0172314582 /NCGR_PEP_ID=MMETSP1058-20130122/22872_1 /TAXON_ID=83371 /ORGANISM="Detonula confervacea, Strain CCMP 353" /LENGTH=59 /DNA_ID=CAMNT_0013028479 /DNA_START=117 /DNA_END=293 /DNA_ORIENTATION=-
MDMLKARVCPFCRGEHIKYAADNMKQALKLANAGHSKAIHRVASYHFQGEMGLRQDKAE